MSMNRFVAYAAAFEDAYTTDDWSKLDPFFTTDAVYETFAAPPFGNRNEGYPRMEGEETVVFAGDRIQRLEDRIPAAEGERTMTYMVAHGSKLRG